MQSYVSTSKASLTGRQSLPGHSGIQINCAHSAPELGALATNIFPQTKICKKKPIYDSQAATHAFNICRVETPSKGVRDVINTLVEIANCNAYISIGRYVWFGLVWFFI